MTIKACIEKCLAGEDLTEQEAGAALEFIMTGQATDIQIAGLLIALRGKGESVEEITGFARTMREHAIKVTVHDHDAIDMCGTGGDGRGSFNISTVAALVAAGAGVTVAKHGNRSVSSRSGSADILAALGVNIQRSPGEIEECINSVGIGFLFAPQFHPAMKFAAKPRVELGVRTIFNILGPMTNPAGVRRQLVGSFSKDVASLLVGVLRRLSAARACVVHSADGMDEISIAAPTTMFELTDLATVEESVITPASFSLPTGTTGDMAGGTAEENAGLALQVLRGERTSARDVVIANAAVGIYIGGKAGTLGEGAMMATQSIDSGKALSTLNKLIEFTNRP